MTNKLKTKNLKNGFFYNKNLSGLDLNRNRTIFDGFENTESTFRFENRKLLLLNFRSNRKKTDNGVNIHFAFWNILTVFKKLASKNCAIIKMSICFR